MDATTQVRVRWFHVTPGRFVLLLLAIEVLLWHSERLGWLGWHKGYAVLAGVAVMGVAMVLMVGWFGIAVVFGRRFQFSLRSLLVLVVVVALPCSWLATEMKRAKRQREAADLFLASDCFVFSDDDIYENGSVHITRSGPVPSRGPLLRLLGWEFFHAATAVSHSPFESEFDDSQSEEVRKYNTENSVGFGARRYCQRNVAEAVLLALAGLPNLRFLDLSDTPVNDYDLEHIMPLNELRQLDLTDTKVTDEGVTKLQQALPNCKIYH